MRLLETKKIDEKRHNKVTFIRIEPLNIQNTLENIVERLSDLSWISKFDEEYIRESFLARATPTVQAITQKLQQSSHDEVSSDAGEYIVSELSRSAIGLQMNYNSIPLTELFSKQVSGNPGFDFHLENDCRTLLFGEAKYLSDRNAYGVGLKQIVDFLSDKKDIKDIADLDLFFCKETLQNAIHGQKGFAVGFAAKTTATETLISNIQDNADYQSLLQYHELVLVAVNL